MIDCDRIRSWHCDDEGNCIADCPARSGGVCEVALDITCTGRPCPVRRLQLALGPAATATSTAAAPTTSGPAEPSAVEDRIVDALRAGPKDARHLRGAVTGKAKEIDAARDELVAAGAVQRSVSGARTIFALVDGPGEAAPEAEPAGTRNDDAGDTQTTETEPDAGSATLDDLDAEFERAREVEGTAARPRKIRVDREDPT